METELIVGDLIRTSGSFIKRRCAFSGSDDEAYFGIIRVIRGSDCVVEFTIDDPSFQAITSVSRREAWMKIDHLLKVDVTIRTGDIVTVVGDESLCEGHSGKVSGYLSSGEDVYFSVAFDEEESYPKGVLDEFHECNGQVPNGFGYFYLENEIRRELKKEEIMSKIKEAEVVISTKAVNKVVSVDGIIGLEEEKRMLKQAIDHNLSVLLIGETGVGKTYLIQQVAKEIGQEAVRISLNGEVGTNEILGKWLAKDGSTYWQDGSIVHCMRTGKWAIGDEINAALPEVLMAINPILDDGRSIVLSEKDNERIEPHPDFRFFATMNPPEGYAGTKDMNSALMDRFGIVMKLGYYKPTTEIQILKYHTRIEDVLGKIVIDVGNTIRGLRKANRVFFPCGTRSLVNWAKLIVIDGNSLETTFKYSILNKCSDEDARIIYDEVTRAIKIKIDWKASGEDNVRRLTDEMATDIAQISEMKKTLQSYAEEIKTRAKVKEVVS